MPEQESINQWWADLRHGGMIIAPAVLDETFPSGAAPVNGHPYQKLRDAWNRFDAWRQSRESESGSAERLYEWLDALLEEYLRHSPDQWQKGPQVADQFKAETLAGERLRANRVLMRDGGDEAALLLIVDRCKRVGLGRSRRTHANLLHLLRQTGHKIGLLTNGVQFRLVYAGLDHDAWVEWDAEAWFAEGELRRQLGGFVALLGAQGMQARDGLAFPLLDAVETSRNRQGELSQVMGEQVRRAIEKVLAHVDRATRSRPELLDDLRRNPETGEALDEAEWLAAMFQAATRLVMRLVVALFAEARDLLPKSLESYYRSYSVEGLFELLTHAEANEGAAGLELRRYACRAGSFPSTPAASASSGRSSCGSRRRTGLTASATRTTSSVRPGGRISSASLRRSAAAKPSPPPTRPATSRNSPTCPRACRGGCCSGGNRNDEGRGALVSEVRGLDRSE